MSFALRASARSLGFLMGYNLIERNVLILIFIIISKSQFILVILFVNHQQQTLLYISTD